MDRLGVQLACPEKRDEAPKAPCQRLCEGFIPAESFVLQPESENDEHIRGPVEFTVEAGDEPVTPQDRQGVVAELSLALGLVDLPDVIETK